MLLEFCWRGVVTASDWVSWMAVGGDVGLIGRSLGMVKAEGMVSSGSEGEEVTVGLEEPAATERSERGIRWL